MTTIVLRHDELPTVERTGITERDWQTVAKLVEHAAVYCDWEDAEPGSPVEEFREATVVLLDHLEAWYDDAARVHDELERLRARTYADYLQTPEWQAHRRATLTRDGFRCLACGRRNRLQVHHLSYARVGREHPDDLLTLCRDCHSTWHDDGDP